jgi:hypothetical protein
MICDLVRHLLDVVPLMQTDGLPDIRLNMMTCFLQVLGKGTLLTRSPVKRKPRSATLANHGNQRLKR